MAAALLAVAGIARPERFFDDLRAAGLSARRTMAFAIITSSSRADIDAHRRRRRAQRCRGRRDDRERRDAARGAGSVGHAVRRGAAARAHRTRRRILQRGSRRVSSGRARSVRPSATMIRHRLEYLGVRMLIVAVRCMPPAVVDACGSALGMTFLRPRPAASAHRRAQCRRGVSHAHRPPSTPRSCEARSGTSDACCSNC